MPKNLQVHQLRVASVAKQICDAFGNENISIDTHSVVTACLLHDMGNIIKFDLSYFPEFVEPEGLDYWQNVKNQFIGKYGNNEHLATDAIAKEVGLSEKVLSMLELTGFSKVLQVLNDNSTEKKICNYADMRVGPFGILSIDQRAKDGEARHARKTSVTKNDRTDFGEVVKGLAKLEQQIFTNLKIKPGDINNQSIEKIIEELKNWQL